jgi:membrane fusion protein (multidrug efflux system)
MTPVPTRRAAAVAAALALAAACGGCQRQAPAPAREPEEVVVAVGAVHAEAAGVRAVVRASGVVAPAEGGEFLARAPEPARIVDVLKNVGDRVQSGDELVRFDLPSTTQELARLDADIAAAQAQLERTRVNQSRVRDLAARGLIPRRDVEIADREYADAQTGVDRLAKARAGATAAAERAIVRAPFDGIVAARRYNSGDVVTSPDDPVLRVVDPRRLEVIASVPKADVPRVVQGATARIASAPGGTPVRLTVRGRLPASGDEVLFRLLFELPPDLPVDTRVEIDIDAEERTDAVLVPLEALIRRGGEAAVMVASGSRAERRIVQTGIEDQARIEITSGVRAGELVITRGHVGLEDGAAITTAIDAR